VLLLSGGYAATPSRTAELHAVAFRVAVDLYERRSADLAIGSASA